MGERESYGGAHTEREAEGKAGREPDGILGDWSRESLPGGRVEEGGDGRGKLKGERGI